MPGSVTRIKREKWKTDVKKMYGQYVRDMTD